MQSSLIGKIQKAHQYADEPDRITVSEFSATFRGDHGDYLVTFREGHWGCNCEFFHQWSVCSHVMATQRVLGVVSPQDATPAEPALT